MSARVWGNDYRTTTVCIDSYEKGNPIGRFYNPYHKDGISFQSTSQFLIKMEQAMDEMELPKAFTAIRSFTQQASASKDVTDVEERYGAAATFQIKVLFRQNTSWQGMVVWVEGKQEESFRSVLELICLMDSAMNCEKPA